MDTPRETGNPEGLQSDSVHQFEIMPTVQQLTYQNTGATRDGPAICLPRDQQVVSQRHVGVPATQHMTKSTMLLNSSSQTFTSEALDVTTTDTDQTINGVSDRTEKSSTGVNKGLLITKEDKNENSTVSHSVVSPMTGKTSSKTIPRRGGKVIVNISDTTYFLSRKRWRQLHKQWYPLIKYLKIKQTTISTYKSGLKFTNFNRSSWVWVVVLRMPVQLHICQVLSSFRSKCLCVYH